MRDYAPLNPSSSYSSSQHLKSRILTVTLLPLLQSHVVSLKVGCKDVVLFMNLDRKQVSATTFLERVSRSFRLTALTLCDIILQGWQLTGHSFPYIWPATTCMCFCSTSSSMQEVHRRRRVRWDEQSVLHTCQHVVTLMWFHMTWSRVEQRLEETDMGWGFLHINVINCLLFLHGCYFLTF